MFHISPMCACIWNQSIFNTRIAQKFAVSNAALQTYIATFQILNGLFGNANDYDCCMLSSVPLKRALKCIPPLEIPYALLILLPIFPNCIKNFPPKQKDACILHTHPHPLCTWTAANTCQCIYSELEGKKASQLMVLQFHSDAHVCVRLCAWVT